jgi:hypothetical protein
LLGSACPFPLRFEWPGIKINFYPKISFRLPQAVVIEIDALPTHPNKKDKA